MDDLTAIFCSKQPFAHIGKYDKGFLQDDPDDGEIDEASGDRDRRHLPQGTRASKSQYPQRGGFVSDMDKLPSSMRPGRKDDDGFDK